MGDIVGVSVVGSLETLSGLLVVDKPSGMTSHDVVNKVRRVFHTKRVGHTGTLDPLATGVLVLCLGHATRLVEYLTSDTKEYDTTVRLGLTSDTEDISGALSEGPSAISITEQDVRSVIDAFRGSQLQTPPMVSALHHEGKRLYTIAREGRVVEREARPITVYSAECLAFRQGERAEIDLRLVVSQGTYIRTIAADIGAMLGVGGVMTALRRIRCGAFSIDLAVSMSDLNQDVNPKRWLTSIERAWGDRPIISLSSLQADDLRMGRQVAVSELSDSAAALAVCNSEPIGIVRIVGQLASPVKVFANRK